VRTLRKDKFVQIYQAPVQKLVPGLLLYDTSVISDFWKTGQRLKGEKEDATDVLYTLPKKDPKIRLMLETL